MQSERSFRWYQAITSVWSIRNNTCSPDVPSGDIRLFITSVWSIRNNACSPNVPSGDISVVLVCEVLEIIHAVQTYLQVISGEYRNVEVECSPDIEDSCAVVPYFVKSCRSSIIERRVGYLHKGVGASRSSRFKKNEFKWQAIERMYRNRNGEINRLFRATPSTYCDFMLVIQLWWNSSRIKYHLLGLVWFNALFTGL
jgi:hypothetical protein